MKSTRLTELLPLYRDGLLKDTIPWWQQRFCDREFGGYLKPRKRCLLETVQADDSMLDNPEGRTVNPGHAIETSWFIMEEGRQRGDKNLIEQACQILEWSLEIGWDPEPGGILYFVDCDGKQAEPYEHELKLWWPHNEALYACLLAFHLTGDAKWADWWLKGIPGSQRWPWPFLGISRDVGPCYGQN